MMYEHHTAPLLPRHLFWRRMLRHGGMALLAVVVSLAAGTAGYHRLLHHFHLERSERSR